MSNKQLWNVLNVALRVYVRVFTIVCNLPLAVLRNRAAVRCHRKPKKFVKRGANPFVFDYVLDAQGVPKRVLCPPAAVRSESSVGAPPIVIKFAALTLAALLCLLL